MFNLGYAKSEGCMRIQDSLFCGHSLTKAKNAGCGYTPQGLAACSVRTSDVHAELDVQQPKVLSPQA